jgi:hypothetical protein
MARLKTICIVLPLIFLIVWIAPAAAEKMMSVQVKTGQLRAAPSFLGKIVATVSYGDRVGVKEEKGAWSRVGLPGGGIEGWIHTSALTPKKIVLKAGASDVSRTASSEEIALAGKGFNEQVEGEFKAKNPDLDFTWVNRMEKIVVTQEEMQRFLKEGEVSPKGGAQ